MALPPKNEYFGSYAAGIPSQFAFWLTDLRSETWRYHVRKTQLELLSGMCRRPSPQSGVTTGGGRHLSLQIRASAVVHSIVAGNVLRSDIACGLGFYAGGAESSESAEESELPEEFTPWGKYHCRPPRLRATAYAG
jgi:hypothetical protein